MIRPEEMQTLWMGPALELADSADWSVPGLWSLLDAAAAATARLSTLPDWGLDHPPIRDTDQDHALMLATVFLGHALEVYESANPDARTPSLAVTVANPSENDRDPSVQALTVLLGQIADRMLDLAGTGGLTLREQQGVVHAMGWVLVAQNRLSGDDSKRRQA